MALEDSKMIQQWAGDLDGVFTIADLKVVLHEDANTTLFRRIAKLVAAGILVKIKRGVYGTPTATLTAMSSRIEPDSYISTGTVLAQRAIIGSIPAKRIQAVKVGRPRIYRFEQGVIEHLSIDPKYHFGFESHNGTLWATPEKAFLDVCYYHYKGKVFSFDPASDINYQDLDFATITDYLTRFDQRFITFFRSTWKAP